MKRKLLSLLLALILCLSLAVCASAAQGDTHVMDEAGLLTRTEETALQSKLEEISHTYNAQIVIVTVPSAEGRSVDFLTEDLYDSLGFGYGEKHDGVLLLVCMDPREYRILSNGYAGAAIDPDTIGDIGDKIVSDLSDGDYAGAFDTFADECAWYLNGYLNGFPFDAGMSMAIALLVGILAGVITAFVLKGQLKTVRSRNQANDYVTPGSMNLRLRRDIFLYRNVTRTKKASSSSSSRSGGGSSRSMGGGSF